MCNIMTFYFILPFFMFLSFEGRQKRCFCSYLSSIAMRNSDLCSSLKSGKVMRCADSILFKQSILIDKSKEDRLMRWTLKRFQMTFSWTKLDLWVDFSLSFTWLFINSFKRTFKVKCPIDTYFIIFLFNQSYGMNDRLKFILSFIMRDNGLNDRSKLVKNGRKGYRK